MLFLGACARGALTYAVGRGLRAGGAASRWSRHLERPLVARCEDLVRRYGAPVVAVGFLTVGVQTAINAASGALRMPLRRFVPGLVVGALLWAALYATVGLAVVDSLLGRVPWWYAVLGLLAALAGVVGSRWLRRRLLGGPAAGPGADH